MRLIDNLPLIGYLINKGRCHSCKAAISPRYLVNELACAALAAACATQFGMTVTAAAAAVLLFSLVALTNIDIEMQLLPDAITLPLLWAGLAVNTAGLFTDPVSAIFGAIAGYGSLRLIYEIFRVFTGKEGMGFGDFKLLGALGAWLGWQALPNIILFASVSGVVIALLRMFFSNFSRDTHYAFGPYLAAGGALTLFFGPVLATWLHH